MAYINGDELIKTIEAICHPADLTDLKCIIKNLKTADVVKVSHGKWIKKTNGGCYWYECSKCNNRPLQDEYKQACFSDYCPHCGRKMEDETV